MIDAGGGAVLPGLIDAHVHLAPGARAQSLTFGFTTELDRQGHNNGFIGPESSSDWSMAYYTGEEIPFYYSLARTFPLCDRYFCSVLAQTYPNRRFLLAGTAFGLIATDDSSITGIPPNGTIFDRLDAHNISGRAMPPTSPPST